MTPKLYLSRAKWLDRKIRIRMDELAEYKSTLASVQAVVYDKDKVQTSSTADKLPAAMARIAEMENEIDKLIDEFYTTKHKIIGQIEGLENDVHREILHLRYIDGLSLEAIAEKLHYSFDWIRHKHGMALLDFGERYLHDNTQKHI